MLDDLKLINQRDKQGSLSVAAKTWQQFRVGDTKLSERAAGRLKNELASWTETVPTSRNLAKQIALELVGRSVVIYSGPELASAARKWKQSINSVAKQIAWIGEVSLDEAAGWTRQPEQKLYAVVELVSDLDDRSVQRYFSASEKILSGLKPHPIRLKCVGKSAPEQALWASVLGDFVSIYLALLNNIDPSERSIFAKIKKEMEE